MVRNIPLSMDAALLAQVDATADAIGENRSLVMRRALRLGLPLVRNFESPAPLASMSELKREKRKARAGR